MSGRTRRSWRTLTRLALAASAALFFAMWIASHWTYTSLGIDRETLEPSGAVHSRYDRVRWAGDGSLWIGGGYSRAPASPSQKVQSFDLGGVFFEPPRRPEVRSAWNRVGFWRVRFDENHRRGESWIGVPGWLPPVLLLLIALLSTWRAR
jgi:hypothetical protein